MNLQPQLVAGAPESSGKYVYNDNCLKLSGNILY